MTRLQALERILGIELDRIGRALSRADVRDPRKRSMRELAAIALGDARLRERASTRRERLTTATSRYWVAGYPRLLEQWHPSKNDDLFPDEVSYGSKKRIWWVCPKGPDHVWRAAPHDRTGRKRGCPFCANRAVSVTNSLASLAPTVAREWHPTKNGGLTAARVVAKSHRSAWWRCASDASHVWRARIANRWWNDAGCPFCAHQRVWTKNSLATTAPLLAREWDRARNGKLTPRDVARTSKRKVWWRCARVPKHRWRARIGDRVKIWPGGCPSCAINPSGASFAERHPELLHEWDRAANGRVGPRDVSHGSHFRAWWRCERNAAHRWQAEVNERSRGSGCPFCAGKRRV